MLEEFNLEKFTSDIDKMIELGIEYPDAICRWCEKNNIEVEVVALIIKKTPALKLKLHESARRLRMVKD